MILTAETAYRATPGVAPAERPVVLHGRPDDVAAMVAAAGKPPATSTLVARVNHGQWIVECPAPGCGGAQVASKTDHRFFCGTCHNAEAGGAWLPVEWPPDEMVAAVEAALLARPDKATRSWRPTETVDDLLAENEAHDLDGGS